MVLRHSEDGKPSDQYPQAVSGEKVVKSVLLNLNSSIPVPSLPDLPGSFLSYTTWFLETHLCLRLKESPHLKRKKKKKLHFKEADNRASCDVWL